jgi:methylmalonyl-CoA carboxyltransferase large subunit
MESHARTESEASESVDDLRQEVIRLQQRIAALERQAPTPDASAGKDPMMGDKLVAVISAALAAYLGVKPHIRQIRLVGGVSWAQQGRVTIQASHILNVRHDQE